MNDQPNKVIAALGYILFLIPLLACPNDQFARFHANQSLLVLGLGIVGRLVGWVPVIGGIVALLISLATLVYFIMGVINALQSKEKQLPYIGHVKIL